MQIHLEDTFLELANNENQPSVLLCDRGLMDGSAYVTEEMWQAIMDEVGLTLYALRDKRYNAVIHMVTAADGASQFYNKENVARYEGIAEAVEVDKRLRNAYMGHYKFFMVDNSVQDFYAKINNVVNIVNKIIGLPFRKSFFKKYLIDIPDPDDHRSLGIPDSLKVIQFELIETIIKPAVSDSRNNIEIYLRKKGKNSSYVYSQEIRYTVNQQRIQKQKIITAREYLELSQ